MYHLVLLGDSIFDNENYVPAGIPVIDHLRAMLPSDWQSTLLAVDGSTTGSIPHQLSRLPQDATHLVLSVGGNDAIGQLNLLQDRVSNIGEALTQLYDYIAEFEQQYQQALHAILAKKLPTTICTIYGGKFENDQERKVTSTALRLFNDAIIKCAIQERLPIIDLRLVCSADADYANPIEPSSLGGHKIAQAIVNAVVQPHQRAKTSEIFTL